MRIFSMSLFWTRIQDRCGLFLSYFFSFDLMFCIIFSLHSSIDFFFYENSRLELGCWDWDIEGRQKRVSEREIVRESERENKRKSVLVLQYAILGRNVKRSWEKRSGGNGSERDKVKEVKDKWRERKDYIYTESSSDLQWNTENNSLKKSKNMLKLEIFFLKFRHTNILLDVNNYKFNKKNESKYWK